MSRRCVLPHLLGSSQERCGNTCVHKTQTWRQKLVLTSSLGEQTMKLSWIFCRTPIRKNNDSSAWARPQSNCLEFQNMIFFFFPQLEFSNELLRYGSIRCTQKSFLNLLKIARDKEVEQGQPQGPRNSNQVNTARFSDPDTKHEQFESNSIYFCSIAQRGRC